jgi:hypothetical protein
MPLLKNIDNGQEFFVMNFIINLVGKILKIEVDRMKNIIFLNL